ncbi:MAG: Fe-S cluster assembly protein SufD [Bacteroidetes bacterium]|nr:Fe-S cluster assembly protein SufD [Bacteroidota bacterium]
MRAVILSLSKYLCSSIEGSFNMETITKINTTEKLINAFESSKNSLFGDLELREQAIESFSKQGIPNRKHEEYKYVNVELLLKRDFAISTATTVTAEQMANVQMLKDAFVVVIENGNFSKNLSSIASLPKGINIQNIAEATGNAAFQKHYAKYADVNNDAFIAMNTAFTSGGVFIHIEKNTVIEKPIHILHVSSAAENAIINPRNLMVVEENAQAKIVESFATVASAGKVFNNALTEIFIGANANLQHYKIQDENEAGMLLNTTQAYQEKQSVFSTNNFTLSGLFVRNNLNIVLDDEFIETHLNGLYLTRGNQVVDNHTLVDHRKPNCNSNELYKGIIEDKSAATFNGKIFVRKDAQKTNAFQSNKNILLSDDGTINTKPQLEIYADDVKCSHGTSTGKLDEDKIFYLRARGLSETSAKKLLMHAFASEVVENIKIEELRDYVEEKITGRFA